MNTTLQPPSNAKPIADKASGAKTYVLVGYEDEKIEGFNYYTHKEYQARGDVIILRANKEKTLEETMQAIVPPANVVLVAHGAKEGWFIWNENQNLTYDKFLAALPRVGTRQAVIHSCFGGSVMQRDFLKHAPENVPIVTHASVNSPTHFYHTQRFILETKTEDNPINLYLKSLDNFNPKVYQEFAINHNKKAKAGEPYFEENPVLALPHMLAIGGKFPLIIDVKAESQKLQANEVAFNREAFDRALIRVYEKFDGVDYPMSTPKAEVNKHIRRVATHMLRGEDYGNVLSVVKDANNKRVAYAITAAYLEESGQFEKILEKQRSMNAAGEMVLALKKNFDAQGVKVMYADEAAARTVEAVADRFSIPIEADGKLSSQEAQNVAKALGLIYKYSYANEAATIDVDMVRAMEKALIAGALPAPKTPTKSSDAEKIQPNNPR